MQYSHSSTQQETFYKGQNCEGSLNDPKQTIPQKLKAGQIYFTIFFFINTSIKYL